MFEKKEKIKCHLSIDDTYSAFVELCDDRYASLWQHPFWRNLRKAHEKWGCSFTLYVFGGLEQQRNLLKKELMMAEFQECSTWIKVTYHGADSDDQAKFKENYYQAKGFFTKLGGKEILAHITRLHMFRGTYDIIDFLKKEGIEFMLTADDDRLSYDLCEKQMQELRKTGIVRHNSMIYLHTDIRLEKCNFLIQYYKWRKRRNKLIVLFTHEYYIKKKIPLVMVKLNFLLNLIQKKYDVSYICE